MVFIVAVVCREVEPPAGVFLTELVSFNIVQLGRPEILGVHLVRCGDGRRRRPDRHAVCIGKSVQRGGTIAVEAAAARADHVIVAVTIDDPRIGAYAQRILVCACHSRAVGGQRGRDRDRCGAAALDALNTREETVVQTKGILSGEAEGVVLVFIQASAADLPAVYRNGDVAGNLRRVLLRFIGACSADSKEVAVDPAAVDGNRDIAGLLIHARRCRLVCRIVTRGEISAVDNKGGISGNIAEGGFARDAAVADTEIGKIAAVYGNSIVAGDARLCDRRAFNHVVTADKDDRADRFEVLAEDDIVTAAGKHAG